MSPAKEHHPLKTNPQMPPESTPFQTGEAIFKKALATELASARYQQFDRALGYFHKAAAIDRENPTVRLFCLAARFLEAGKWEERIGLAKSDAEQVLATEVGEHTPEELHLRAVATAVTGNLESAREAYAGLAAQPGVETPFLAKARHLARHLADANGWPGGCLDDVFPPLKLVVFAGHLPPKVGHECRELVDCELARLGATAGVSSAAAGADLLFLDCLHKHGGASHIILPWSRDSFRETSVLPFDGWEALYHDSIGRCESIREIGAVVTHDSPVAWQYLLEVSAGIAKRIAEESHLDIVPLAVWDGTPGAPGGTAAFHEFWEGRMGARVTVIKPPRSAQTARPRASYDTAKTAFQQEIRSMLFVDVVGFSSLPEISMPAFIEKFLHNVSEVLDATESPPLSVNTWGDAVYAVFGFVHEAGRFALELNEMVENKKEIWEGAGLGALQIRTGLHVGPVFLHHDPVVNRTGFSGAHVNRAARIEPTANSGEILVSEEFAALTAISPTVSFSLEYATTTELKKNYPGRHRLYRLVRDQSADLLLLAKAIHADYCEKSKTYGDTVETNPALVPWDALPLGLQWANLAQAEDIRSKLVALGYCIVASGGIAPSSIRIDPALLEPLAITEHDRWMAEKMRAGWTFAEKRDNAKLHHPLLVPYADLPEVEKEKDRATIRNIPGLLAEAGYRIRAIELR